MRDLCGNSVVDRTRDLHSRTRNSERLSRFSREHHFGITFLRIYQVTMLIAIFGVGSQVCGPFISHTSGIISCKTFFYYIFYVNDLVLPEKWL